MKSLSHFMHWLETHWATPSYSGWVLIGIGLCFFGAATNTMAGWLYVLSGIMAALLIVSAWSAMRSLNHLQVQRLPITPVSAGDDLIIDLEIQNKTPKAKLLLEIRDILPYVLQKPQTIAIEAIPPQTSRKWVYYLPTQRRGIYHWEEVELRTGNPFGLFWCSRTRIVPAKAIVYPQVLPLPQCPLIDTIGQEDSTRLQSNHRYSKATEGVTRTLRSYRYGDPTRLIHWRTSARLGDFKVRELEVITGSQDIIICLDSSFAWEKESFEQAVIAAASLYFYASKSQMNVQLWTAKTGIVAGNRVVLETLAGVETEESLVSATLPDTPLIWLTQNLATLESLHAYSRWLFFSHSQNLPAPMRKESLGIVINLNESLAPQLQQPLKQV